MNIYSKLEQILTNLTDIKMNMSSKISSILVNSTRNREYIVELKTDMKLLKLEIEDLKRKVERI
mgnify:CR=1 FL=1